jgi:uncharacterized protein with gpF-like domain
MQTWPTRNFALYNRASASFITNVSTSLKYSSQFDAALKFAINAAKLRSAALLAAGTQAAYRRSPAGASIARRNRLSPPRRTVSAI